MSIFMKNDHCEKKFKAFFPSPPPTSHKLQYISVTSGFTRLSMRIKYVCRVLISLYVNFHNNRTMWSTNLHGKFCRWGGGGKGERAKFNYKNLQVGAREKEPCRFREEEVSASNTPPPPPPPPPPQSRPWRVML